MQKNAWGLEVVRIVASVEPAAGRWLVFADSPSSALFNKKQQLVTRLRSSDLDKVLLLADGRKATHLPPALRFAAYQKSGCVPIPCP